VQSAASAYFQGIHKARIAIVDHRHAPDLRRSAA
jgi:hypothetical protein